MNENVIETGTHHGLLEVECIVRRADGTIKEIEKSTRPVVFKLDQTGEQITEMQEVKEDGNSSERRA
jgi:hypothetical protein